MPGADWEDVLQDALGAAWRKRSQFDQQRGTARNWLLAIVADQANKHRRRAWRSAIYLRDEAYEQRTGDVDLDNAIRRLTPRQRLAVVLHYYQDLPIADVAEVMACTPGTVKSTLSDARARLRDDLGKDKQ